MMRGIAAVKPGATTGDVGYAIQNFAETQRFSAWCAISAVTASAGVFHDAPNVMHFGVPGEGVMLKPGMIFTIEPMINPGSPIPRSSTTAGPP